MLHDHHVVAPHLICVYHFTLCLKYTFDVSLRVNIKFNGNKPHQAVVLHALLGPASLAINDLEVGSDCLHGPRCRSNSCGETPNMFLRKISMTKHETIIFC
jgi:hypothetical protein